MKKTRNSFFSEANMSYSGYNPNFNPNMNMMAANQPFQSASAYNAFYTGPYPGNTSQPSDLESRLAKMERQISRLEHRVSKLESTNTYTTDDFDSTTNNMYML